MLKFSLCFLFISILCFFCVDTQISHPSSFSELELIFQGFCQPQISLLSEGYILSALQTTLIIAILAIAISFSVGIILALNYDKKTIRFSCTFIRSIHEIFWALLLVNCLGFNILSGIIAIALPFSASFAKVFREIYEETDPHKFSALPKNSTRASYFFYGLVPCMYQQVQSYFSYRLECALRSSAILGFIGLPTIGFHLESFFRESYYSNAAMLIYLLVLIIVISRYFSKPKLFTLASITCFILCSWQIHYDGNSILNFASELIPWPLQAENHSWSAWSSQLASESFWGSWETLLATQIAISLTAILALFSFPFSSKNYSPFLIRQTSKALLVFLRSIPDYVLAFIFILFMGVSFLPIILAIAIHNAAVLAYLLSMYCDNELNQKRLFRRKIDAFFYQTLPQIYGQFLAFLFYRWEMMIRESSLLGLVGVGTLGFYIHSAISEMKFDEALILILCSAIITMLVDISSQKIRQHYSLRFKQL